MINEYESYLTGSLVDVVKPSFTRKSAGFGVIGSDVERVRDQLNALVGTARKDHYHFLDFRDHFDHMATTGKMNGSMQVEFAKLIDHDEGAVWKCIDHLNEMARATDLHKIPKRWYRVFNRYMEEIRSFDIEANGYGGVYNQIEGAYNIYKLSTHPAAIKYGLSKVSEKMPWNLFDVFAEQGIDMKYLPSSSFFRYEGEFVPWYDGIRANKKGTFSIYSSAHYDPTCKHVSINRAFFDRTNGRAAGNPFEAQQIFYHEYGHALDWQRDWRFKKKVGDVFDKYAAKYGDMDKDELDAKFWEAMWKVTDKSEKYIKEGVIDGAINEQSAALSDVLQAMRKDGLKISSGHDDDYFMVRGKDGKPVLGKDGQPQFYRSSQLAEFVAHMNENFWLYNDVWEAFDAEFYKEVKSIMRKAYRGAANALD